MKNNIYKISNEFGRIIFSINYDDNIGIIEDIVIFEQYRGKGKLKELMQLAIDFLYIKDCINSLASVNRCNNMNLIYEHWTERKLDTCDPVWFQLFDNKFKEIEIK